MRAHPAVHALALAAFALLSACDRPGTSPKTIILATTTSLQDTGLLDELIPAFQARAGINVKPVAVGSGEAIAMARRGEADVVLSHSPEDEEAIVKDGFASDRRVLMRNFFKVVGPPADPAGVTRTSAAVEAFRAIAAARVPFVTRGDRSGTHKKELFLWKKAGLDPTNEAPWYVRARTGMAETLRIADERRAYAIADESTFLAQRARLSLAVLFDRRDPDLKNVYSVLVLDPGKLLNVDASGGRVFADFVSGAEGRAVVERFGAAKYGRPLFELEKAR